jgi:5-methyltetrahydrofolate--homocysteine methyltransferase
LIAIAEARERKVPIAWDNFSVKEPSFLGYKVVKDVAIRDLVPYIDWTPFFRSWELHGKYPAILTDEVVGEQATDLFADAQEMLKKIISEKKLKAKGIFGLFPANSINDDDILLDTSSNLDENTGALSGAEVKENHTFRTLRQQLERREGVADYALADFIAPKETGKQDYIGCFCVSTGFGTAELAAQYEKDLDDYNSIMVKALADRLAEAFAEYLHKEVRTEHWGYASNEDLSNEDLIKESYKGIRPAPGYPACPDHLEKLTIWEILKVKETIGVELTDSLAMWPAASVSGYYFGNPEARYFGLGKIKEDQVKDFAERKE